MVLRRIGFVLALAAMLPAIAIAAPRVSIEANGVPVDTANPLPVTGTITSSTATQADPGSDATKATAVQGVTGGKAVSVAGAGAAGAAATGNPVGVGGVYNSTSPTLTTGQRGDLQLSAKGAVIVQICSRDAASSSASCPQVIAPQDGVGAVAGGLETLSIDYVYDPDVGVNTHNRAYVCSTPVSVNVTAGNTLQIVALSSGKIIRVCSISLGISASGTVAFTSGTGTNCGTPANAMQAINLSTGNIWTQNAPPGAAIYYGSSSGELCISAVTGNVVGFLTYAQF